MPQQQQREMGVAGGRVGIEGLAVLVVVVLVGGCAGWRGDCTWEGWVEGIVYPGGGMWAWGFFFSLFL